MSAKTEMQRLDELREHKRRCIPVKCVHRSFAYLPEGAVGLVSKEELMHGRAYLKPVTCDEFDAENHKGYGKPLKKKTKEASNEE